MSKALLPIPAPRPPIPPAQPRGMGRRTRLGATTREALHKWGPRWLHGQSLAIQQPDWCTPPPTFVGAHTSASEWMIYKALSRLLGDPPHPENPPYAGGVNWTYQDPLLGGRLSRGGQVCDFLVSQTEAGDVCIRLQSEHYHVFADNAKKVDELYEKTHSPSGVIIRDIYEQDFVADCTGEAACRVTAQVLAGREASDPAVSGRAQQTHRRGGTTPATGGTR